VAPRPRQRVEFQRREAHLDGFGRRFRIVLGLGFLVAPAVGVDPDALLAGAAQQIVDGLARGLADDVPQRRLDAGDGAVEFERAAPLGEIVVEHGGEVLDPERIAAHQIAAHLLDMGDHLRDPGRTGYRLRPSR